ncbi:hypothetical protein BT69DRAFT_317652 [Atractiella rhizophila]|nr:hypothetical protein BT69DRAFT_317652 [Atractiella rhizophila]
MSTLRRERETLPLKKPCCEPICLVVSSQEGGELEEAQKKKNRKKRTLEETTDDSNKVAKVGDGERRYSLRNRDQLKAKKEENERKAAASSADDFVVSDEDEGGTANGGQRLQSRLKADKNRNPKVFGHIPGIEVGRTFAGRMEASQLSVHGPVVAGISGHETKGVWSVSLAGGYEDDIDLGYSFTFTGSGGRDLKGTKANPKNLRTAPQTMDQEFTKMNLALKRSVETGKPIRVLRGFKGHSPWAPETGYRYDGLYVCKKAWMEKGKAGFNVCRYALVRLEGQPPLSIREGREAEVEALGMTPAT